MSDKSPHEKALEPYLYIVEETPQGNWAVKSPQRERPLVILPSKFDALSLAFTLNAEYSSLYDKGWERGYDVGDEVATKWTTQEGYQPGDAVDLGDPPGDE